MAVRLRLTRVGSRKNPIWRVVAADERSKRDGRVLETLGRYNPQRQPSEIVLDREGVDRWLARGAQPSETVRKLIIAAERGGPPAGAPGSGGSVTPAAQGATGPAEEQGAGAEGSSGAEEGSPPPADGPSPTAGDAVTADELTGDPAAAEEGATVADAAPADEVASPAESEG